MSIGIPRTTLGALLCASLCVAGSASARDRGVSDQTSSRQTLHFAGPGPHTLEVRAINGSITVEAYDGRDVEMTVDKSIVADTDDDLRAAQRDVRLDVSDNAADIKAIVRQPSQGTCGQKNGVWDRHWHEPSYSVKFDITLRVPRDTNVQLCTINDGNLTVSGTRGDFAIQGINGSIAMVDVAGSGDAVTINGRVTASFIAAPRGPSLFKSINGDIEVTMPDGLDAELRMKSFNGGLFTDFEVQPVATQVTAEREQRNGMTVYRSKGFTTVRAGNGGPQLTLETLNGDVRVLRRAK
jgi:DUF4097 and DUF4098 domain-containing protein YvlB